MVDMLPAPMTELSEAVTVRWLSPALDGQRTGLGLALADENGRTGLHDAHSLNRYLAEHEDVDVPENQHHSQD